MASNSNSPVELNKMLLKFRAQDLQNLLSAMGKNKSGRKNELYIRAKEMLTNPPKNFHSDGYARKIKKLYAIVLNETKTMNGGDQTAAAVVGSTAILPSVPPDSAGGLNSRDYRSQQIQWQQQQQQQQQQRLQHQQQQRLQIQQQQHQQHQRLQMQQQQIQQQIQSQQQQQQVQPHHVRYLTPGEYSTTYVGHHPQQPQSQATVAHPIAYSHIPQVAAATPAYQYQVATATASQNSVAAAAAAATSAAAFHHQLEPVPNLNFKKIPFFKIRSILLHPTLLTANSPLSLPPNYPKSNVIVECAYVFALTVDQINYISDVMDVREKPYDYPTQALLRLGKYDVSNNSNTIVMCEDFMPLNLLVRLNNEQSPLPPNMPITKPGMDIRRQPRPVNITGQVRLNPQSQNTIKINWIPEADKKFCFALYISERLNSDDLLNAVLAHRLIPSQITKESIIERVKSCDEGNDDDIVSTTKLTVSLTCPLGASRLVYPAKGKDCGHITFFDALNYISLNEKKPSWMCPICRNSVPFDNMEIYQYFMDVLKAGNLPSDCTQIELLSDGSWKVCGDHYDEDDDDDDDDSDAKSERTDATNLDNNDDAVVAAKSGKESENEIIDTKPNVQPQASNNNNEDAAVAAPSTAAAVVDLTSDDEAEEAAGVRCESVESESEMEQNSANSNISTKGDSLSPENNKVEV